MIYVSQVLVLLSWNSMDNEAILIVDDDRGLLQMLKTLENPNRNRKVNRHFACGG